MGLYLCYFCPRNENRDEEPSIHKVIQAEDEYGALKKFTSEIGNSKGCSGVFSEEATIELLVNEETKKHLVLA